MVTTSSNGFSQSTSRGRHFRRLRFHAKRRRCMVDGLTWRRADLCCADTDCRFLAIFSTGPSSRRRWRYRRPPQAAETPSNDLARLRVTSLEPGGNLSSPHVRSIPGGGRQAAGEVSTPGEPVNQEWLYLVIQHLNPVVGINNLVEVNSDPKLNLQDLLKSANPPDVLARTVHSGSGAHCGQPTGQSH